MYPLISLVITVYNISKYVSQCLDSVIAQTYNNLEIIVVDDGSTDGSGAICDSYINKDSRIKVIHQTNQGLSAARNAGIKESSGEYISFVDGDDVIHPQMIEFLYEAIGNNQLSACGYKNFKNKIAVNNHNFENLLTLFFYDYAKYPNWIVSWGKLYKKSIFNNILFPVGRICEDTFVTYKICDEVKQIVYIDLPLYFYRTRKDSITHKVSEKNFYDYVDALHEMLDFIKSNFDHSLYVQIVNNLSAVYGQFYTLRLFSKVKVLKNDLQALHAKIICLNKKIKGIPKLKNNIKVYLPVLYYSLRCVKSSLLCR